MRDPSTTAPVGASAQDDMKGQGAAVTAAQDDMKGQGAAVAAAQDDKLGAGAAQVCHSERAKRVEGSPSTYEDAPVYLSTDKLVVGYGGVPLIKNVDIELKRGEILTLIGPNGAGKSTILKSIANYLEPIGGAVYISGRPLGELSSRELSFELSVMLTERLRTELMTCMDVVETGRYPYTGRLGILSEEDREKVREAMEMVHIWDLRNRDFMQISDGQRQRIMLARAICQEPHVIMLDEPTNYLDIHYQIELLNILRRLVHTRDVAVIMSLHELPLARKVSTRVMCVKGDSIVAVGTPDEIFTPQVIDDLYDLAPGVYDSVSGNIQLEEL